MPTAIWQKSSYCGQGDSCVHVAASPGTVHLTETGDPAGAILKAPPAAFATLLTALKHDLPHPSVKTQGTRILIHTPTTTVTTDQSKWDAFVLGVKASEFDHFASHGDPAHAAAPLPHGCDLRHIASHHSIGRLDIWLLGIS